MANTRRMAWFCALATAACGGQPKVSPDDSSWMEEDDSSAQLVCHPSCVSGDWRNQAAKRVLYDVTRCTDRPVYTNVSLDRRVTIRVDPTTCEDAIGSVAAALGLRLHVVDGSGGSMPAGAYMLARAGETEGRFVEISVLLGGRAAPATSPGGLTDGGWSRDVESDESYSSSSTVERRTHRRSETRSCGGYGEPECKYLHQKHADCMRRCNSTSSVCYSRCNYGTDPIIRSCQDKCQTQFDTCADTCQSM